MADAAWAGADHNVGGCLYSRCLAACIGQMVCTFAKQRPRRKVRDQGLLTFTARPASWSLSVPFFAFRDKTVTLAGHLLVDLDASASLGFVDRVFLDDSTVTPQGNQVRAGRLAADGSTAFDARFGPF